MGMPLYLQLITAYAGVQQQTLLQGLDLDEFREFESKLHEFFQEELPHVVEALQDVCDQHLLSQVHLGDDNDNDMENDNDNDNDSDDNNDSDSERDRDSDRNNTDGDALSNDDVLALSIGLPRILQSEMYRGCNNFYQVYLYGDDA